jgi:hypothetical protein
VRIAGPTGDWVLDGILDSGSDDTVFPEWLAPMIGVDLTLSAEQEIRLAGRSKPIRCRYTSVTLRITDGMNETYEWDTVVGFVAVAMKWALFGQAGFLQYFDATFQGADYAVILLANWSFSGART